MGQIVGENTYSNRSLDMDLTLPGAWHLTGKATGRGSQSAKPVSPKCPSPFCGGLVIDVALASEQKPFPTYAIFLGAYKLTGEYLNRTKYPLKAFAELMIVKSLGDKWVPEGSMTFVRLGNRPAYRLKVYDHQITSAKGLVYVSEVNQHVFLLVGTALSNQEELQIAIEKMKLGGSIR